ncbi:hypothetical protein LTR17_002847 [Elasticomyces elasticus]|nr:hypothetical protein LTR17_002847 [Elasticomyces elasticus]
MPPTSPEVEEPPAKRLRMDSPARHSPQPTFSDFDFFQDDGPLDSTLQQSALTDYDLYLANEFATAHGTPSPAQLGESSILASNNLRMSDAGKTSAALQLKNGQSEWSAQHACAALGEQSYSPSAQDFTAGLNQSLAYEGYAGRVSDNQPMWVSSDAPSPHHHGQQHYSAMDTSGVGYPVNGNTYLPVLYSQSTPASNAHNDTAESVSDTMSQYPDAGLMAWQAAQGRKRAAEEQAMWAQVLKKTGLAPQDCHDRMFPPCSVQDHLVQWIKQPNVVMRYKKLVAAIRSTQVEAPGVERRCISTHQAGYATNKREMRSLRCRVAGCKGDKKIHLLSIQRIFAGIKAAEEGHAWKIALNDFDGGRVFDCSGRCNTYPTTNHCLEWDHLLLETENKNMQRCRHHHQRAGCFCEKHCIGPLVVLDRETTTEVNARPFDQRASARRGLRNFQPRLLD